MKETLVVSWAIKNRKTIFVASLELEKQTWNTHTHTHTQAHKHIKYKLSQLGLTHWIVDDSDSDDQEFRQQNLSESKSDDEIGFQLMANSIKTLFFNKNQFIFN